MTFYPATIMGTIKVGNFVRYRKKWPLFPNAMLIWVVLSEALPDPTTVIDGVDKKMAKANSSYFFWIMLSGKMVIHSKTNSSKWIDSSAEGHFNTRLFFFNFTRFILKTWNQLRGQRSNKSLKFVINIEVGFLCLYVIFLTSIKLLFDLWPLIQFTIFRTGTLFDLQSE